MKHAVFQRQMIAPTLFAASLLLSACSNGNAEFTSEDASQFLYDTTVGVAENAIMTGNWQQIDAMATLDTQSVVQAHAVNFPNGTIGLTDEERSRLITFLRSRNITRADQILLDGLRSDEQEHLPATSERIETLRLELANLGLRSHVAQTPITAQRAPDDRVALIVTRTLVRLPDCSSEAPGRGDRPVHLRDCANQTNLGLMVANPADLHSGTAGGPADGAASVLGIERYRSGEITPLIDALSTQGIE